MQSALIGGEMDKFDTVHENETGYILVLASVRQNDHHATETGFSFCLSEPNDGTEGIQEGGKDGDCRI